ncbi:MAG: hypothetical protein ACI3XL_02470 [Eubacteriales bacterium]
MYFIVHHDADTGITYTYWGTAIDNIVVLRDWGIGAGRSFEAGSAITGISFGYVHTTWGQQPPCVLTFSEVGYGATLVDALHLSDVTLAEGNSFEHGSVYVEGRPYGDVVIRFIPDEDYGVGAVTVNGVAMYPDAEGKLVLSGYKKLTVDVTAEFKNNKFSVTKSEGSNATISIKDKDGNELTAEQLSKVQYGTVLTVEVITADGYTVKNGSFVINGVAQTANPVNYTVTENTTIAAEAELRAVLSGTIDGEHYAEYFSSLRVSAGEYAGKIEGSRWTVIVPASLENFTVVIHDESDRFHDVEIALANTDSAVSEVKLIPKMTKIDLWGTHNGVYVPDQNALILNADGSYSIFKTESGLTQSNDNWWASGVTTGAAFAGVSSEYWVMETEIVVKSNGGWGQWQAGIMVAEKEFIVIMDRDWQTATWTEWNLASSTSGSMTDIITDEKAAEAGIRQFNNWGTADKPMKVTAVRDGKDFYLFLNDIFIGKFDINSSFFPNSNRGATQHLGFMVKLGTEATFKNYWYELGETNVDEYLASKKVSAPTLNVVDGEGNTLSGGSVTYYKQVLISTDNNGYVETKEWQLATEADMVAGTLVKAVFAPINLAEGECVYTGVKVNGNSYTLSDGACTFVLGENDTIELTATLNVPITSVVTVNDRVNLDGVTLTLTKADNSEDVKSLTVADGKLTIGNVWIGDKYNVVVDAADVKISLGTLEITGKAVEWNPVSSITSGTGLVDIGNGTYGVVGAEKGRVDFDAVDGSIPAGDVFVVTKVQVSKADLTALLSAKGESVIGIEMRSADGRAVENMIWINGGSINLLCGGWSNGGTIAQDGVLNDYGRALCGDGLYFGMLYNSSNGMTYTYLGTSMDSLTCIRDWGTGTDEPGSRSFDVGSQITGFSFGYVHKWTGNDSNLRINVTFSDVSVGNPH